MSTRVTKWVFSASPNDAERTIETDDYIVMTGPDEGDGCCHGFIKFNKNQRKNYAAKLLTQLGFSCFYWGPMQHENEYIRYMFKTLEAIPDECVAFLTKHKMNKDPFQKNNFKQVCDQIIEENGGEKPSLHEFSYQYIQKTGNVHVPNLALKRMYDHSEETGNKFFKRLRAIIKQKKQPLVSSEMHELWNEICDNADFKLEQLLKLAVAVAVDDMDSDVKNIILCGDSGAGKTLACKLLFNRDITSYVPVDATGVGAFQKRRDDTVTIIEEVNAAFFKNSNYIQTIKSSFCNDYTVKIHGTKETYSNMRYVMTTNMCKEQILACLGQDEEAAWNRRFLFINFTKKDNKLDQYKEKMSVPINKNEQGTFLHELLAWYNGYDEHIKYWQTSSTLVRMTPDELPTETQPEEEEPVKELEIQEEESSDNSGSVYSPMYSPKYE